MLPHLGAGAGQGFEDAYLVGKLLGDPQTTFSNVEVRMCLLFPCRFRSNDSPLERLTSLRHNSSTSCSKGLGGE